MTAARAKIAEKAVNTMISCKKSIVFVDYMCYAKDLDTWIIQIGQELMELWPVEVHQTTAAAEPSFVAASHAWKISHRTEVPSLIL